MKALTLRNWETSKLTISQQIGSDDILINFLAKIQQLIHIIDHQQ